MSENTLKTGRVTIPTNLDVVPQTIEILKRWGADAIRDCDGTEFPEELTKVGAKIYSTYYTTRKDNAWAKANPDEVQQCYIMTGFYTAENGELRIPLMQGISDELLQVNTRDDMKRWWESNCSAAVWLRSKVNCRDGKTVRRRSLRYFRCQYGMSCSESSQ